MLRPLLVTLLCIWAFPLFAQHRAIDSIRRMRGDTIPGLHILTDSEARHFVPVIRPVKPLSKDELFQSLVSAAEVSVNLNNDFHIVDTFCIYDYYFPKPAMDTLKHKIQILRTVVPNSDSDYMLGIQAIPCFTPKPYKDTTFEKLMDWYADKSSPIQPLSSPQLITLNADSGRGAIYDLDISVPFKKKYNKCKVLAAENKKGEYLALYYFYDGLTDKSIKKVIESQLGMVKFTQWP